MSKSHFASRICCFVVSLLSMFQTIPARAQNNPLSLSANGMLDYSHWQTNTPLLFRLGPAISGQTRWVQPLLTFEKSGLRMGGVNGTFQFTGIQSRATFTPPFRVRATVMGTVANGNAFAFMVVNEDLQQSLRVEGNLNARNGPYHGLSLNVGNNGENILRDVGIGKWYRLTISVDAKGAGTFAVADSQGNPLATKTDLPVGLGPFYVVLGQREGLPYTVGPNVAVWSSVEVLSSAEMTTSHHLAPSALDAFGPGIRSVDFLNFDYKSSCFDGATHISKGEWKGPDGDWFQIKRVIYDNVVGGENDQAAVHTLAYTGGNFGCNEIYVFAMSSGKPKLLARLTPQDWGKGQEDNGGNYQVTDVRTENQKLAVAFLAGGFHACPAWNVTASFQWQGSSFVRTGVDRTPYKCR